MNEHSLETYRSLISISVEFFKSLLLINGGAVVAILAFLGQASNGQVLAKEAWLPLGAFVIGTGFSALSFAGSYATQFALYNESVHPQDYKGPTHMKCTAFTACLVFLSFVAFAVGAFTSVHVLARA